MHKKIISLIMVVIMLTICIVGCRKEECKVIQKQIDIFETINKTDVDTCCMTDYYNSFNIEGLYVDNIGGDDVIFSTMVEDEDLYINFLKDAKEIGWEEAIEKYGMENLIETMIETSVKQQKIASDIYGEEVPVVCNIYIFQDGEIIGSITVCNGEVHITNE